jgi:predicted permease
MQDVYLALRQFRKSPGFAVTVVLTIALGIGANTAIFTLVHAVLLKSLPIADPKTLFRVGDLDDCCVNGGFINENGDFDLYSYNLYKHLQQTTPEFEDLAAIQAGGEAMSIRRGSEPAKSERTEYVSGNYFKILGVGAFAGRALAEADDTAGAAPVVVMSYQAWQSNYGGDPRVLGTTFYLQGKPLTLVGITPPGFFGDRSESNPPEFWIPLAAEPTIEGENSILRVAPSNWLYVLGRPKPGISMLALQEKMSNSLRQWLATEPAYVRNGGSTLIPKQHIIIVPGGAGIQNLQKQTGKGLYLLMTISGLVLLVACANIANLLLARAATRKSETSVRMALGAGRSRLIRQMLTESVLLGFIGGLAGLAVAYAGTRHSRTCISRLAAPANPGKPLLTRAGLHLSPLSSYRHCLWSSAGLDRIALRPSRGPARSKPLNA